MKPSHANLQTKSLAMLLLALWLAPGVCDAVQEGMSPPQSDTNSLCTWTFCNTNWDSDWNYAARSWTNVATATPGNGFSGGYAALIDTNVPAWVCYNLVEADGSTNMTLTQGSIFLSFSPNWASADETNCGTGPGSCGGDCWKLDLSTAPTDISDYTLTRLEPTWYLPVATTKATR